MNRGLAADPTGPPVTPLGSPLNRARVNRGTLRGVVNGAAPRAERNIAVTTPVPQIPRKEPRAMNSTLKILVPLALLLAVVFAVTFFSLNTPTDDDDKKEGPGIGSGEQPLRFFNSIRKWSPVSDATLQNQIWPGHFETGETQRAATFWFENKNAAPVTVTLRGVSCSACSGGRLAPIPPEKTRALLQMAAITSLPQGLMAGLPLGMIGPTADLIPALQWTSFDYGTFKEPKDLEKAVYHVPAATGPAAAGADGWSPQWGILELNFKVRPNSKNPLTTIFETRIDGTDQPAKAEFEIHFLAIGPLEVDPPGINIRDLTIESADLAREVVIYSSTRPPEELAELSVRVDSLAGGGDAAGFVTVGKPVPITGVDLDRFATELTARSNRPIKVQAAYRLPITIRTHVGDARMDIGPISRDIWVAVPGADPKRVLIRGNLRGPVALSEGTELDFVSFDYRQTQNKDFDLKTERPGIEVSLVPDECSPKFVKARLEKQQDRAGRGHYKLWVTIPGGEQLGEITNGVIVLEVKGPHPQRIRLPLRGRGYQPS